MPVSAKLALTLLLLAATPAHAVYDVTDFGDWPESSPKQLAPLRKQSRTLVGPELELLHYAIPFDNREALESAWPYLLKLKSAGAPIVLVRGENFFLGEKHRAGVIVHAPPLNAGAQVGRRSQPIPGQSNPRVAWINSTYLELVVDGEIVDLNRLPFPAETFIIDQRRLEQQPAE